MPLTTSQLKTFPQFALLCIQVGLVTPQRWCRPRTVSDNTAGSRRTRPPVPPAPTSPPVVLFPAGGFADSSVRIYDLEKMANARSLAQDQEADGGEVSLLWGHSGAVYGLDYSPDRHLLFTSSSDGTVRLWSTELAFNLVAYRCALPAAGHSTFIMRHIYILSALWCRTLCLNMSIRELFMPCVLCLVRCLASNSYSADYASYSALNAGLRLQ